VAHVDSVFTPAVRVPLAWLLLAIPALQATGLLSCDTTVSGCSPKGFYSLDTLLEGSGHSDGCVFTGRRLTCMNTVAVVRFSSL